MFVPNANRVLVKFVEPEKKHAHKRAADEPHVTADDKDIIYGTVVAGNRGKYASGDTICWKRELGVEIAYQGEANEHFYVVREDDILGQKTE